MPKIVLTDYNIENMERVVIDHALNTYDTLCEAADALGITLEALRYKIRKYKLRSLSERKGRS